jgi:hypothetical protein
MTRVLEQSDFAPFENQTFLIGDDSGGRVKAELVELKELASETVNGAKRKPFSLVFRCPKDCQLGQRTYEVEHPKMGRLEIFLVPIGPDGRGMCYEAVFN